VDSLALTVPTSIKRSQNGPISIATPSTRSDLAPSASSLNDIESKGKLGGRWYFWITRENIQRSSSSYNPAPSTKRGTDGRSDANKWTTTMTMTTDSVVAVMDGPPLHEFGYPAALKLFISFLFEILETLGYLLLLRRIWSVIGPLIFEQLFSSL